MVQSAYEPARVLELDAVVVHADGGVHGSKEVRVGFEIDKTLPKRVELGFIVGGKTVRSSGEGSGIYMKSQSLDEGAVVFPEVFQFRHAVGKTDCGIGIGGAGDFQKIYPEIGTMLADFVKFAEHQKACVGEFALFGDASDAAEVFVVIVVGEEARVLLSDALAVGGERGGVEVFSAGFFDDFL